ncbi:hypothetical protein [Pseudonocardia adelaidensis]|uniref:Uncharacterized protein n=1 Tax=Pseudonocardia adelaidensis TaxID=648754 RepID=A0ABP9NIS5_9PSEU
MSTNEVHRMIRAVESIGITPTKAVNEAIERSGFVVNRPSAEEAQRALRDAASQHDYDQAVYATAVAMTVAQVAESPAFTSALNGVRESALREAVRPWAVDVLPDMCERFNNAAPGFSAALTAVPEGAASGSILDTGPDTVAALMAVREAAEPLHATYAAYKAVLTFLGDPVPSGRTGPGASVIVSQIGSDFPDDDALWNATNDVYAWSMSHGVELPQLYPFVPIVRRGGRLELVEPSEANRRLVEIPDARRN